MERIRLTRQEKTVLRQLQGDAQAPRNLSPTVYEYSLSTLQEKGLVRFKSDNGEVAGVRLTLKGRAYIEQNPQLRNPIDWYRVITLALGGLTAISTTCALFIACTKL